MVFIKNINNITLLPLKKESNMKKLEVGQVLWGVKIKNRPKEASKSFTVTKIGRQYFYASDNLQYEHCTVRFRRQDWVQDESAIYPVEEWQLYESEKHYNEMIELGNKNKGLEAFFRQTGCKKLETVNEILDLIKEDQNDK